MALHQRGAGPWRQGADTCVFKPAVSCADNPSVEYGPEYVSRVTTPDDRAAQVETILKKEFSDLIDSGWVTAYEHSCKPYYKAPDYKFTDSFKDKYVRPMRLGKRIQPYGACETKIRANNIASNAQVNLISKRVGDAFADVHVNRFDIRQCVDELQYAFSAAVALVPDVGTWILHTDLHSGNILRNDTSGKYMLHDWGRSIVIENANVDTNVVKGIQTFRDEVYPASDWPSVPVAFQLPKQMVDAVMNIYATGSVTPQEKRILRIWHVFVLFKTVLHYSNMLPNTTSPGMSMSDMDDQIFRFLLTNATSQSQLGFAVDAIVATFLQPGAKVTPPNYVLNPDL